MKRAHSPDLRRAVEVALREAQELDTIRDEMRRALEAHDEQLALALLRRYLGLPPVRVS